jgi:hypothetical protein
MLLGRVLFFAACPLVLCGAEPFTLKLPDLSGVWFESGAVIQVPPGKCAQLQVRLAAPLSHETGIDQLSLTLDGAYPRFSRATGAEGHILTIATREPLGLLTGSEHHIELSSNGPNPLRAEWTILKWDKPYIEATMVSPHGVPVGIRIDQPAGGIVLPSAAGARFAGEVSGSLDSRLTIAGHSVKRLPNQPGFHFDQQIELPAEAKEIVILATDDHDSTALVLPVLSPGGR